MTEELHGTLKNTAVIKAIIVEDELSSLNYLKNLLSNYCENLEVVGEATTVEEGTELLEDPNLEVDVAFLDINLPDGKVFQMLEPYRPLDFEVIFVTAYDEFAIKACEYSSVGYIVKPIDPEALVQAVERIRPFRHNRKMEGRLELFHKYYGNPNAFEKLSIAATDGIYFVHIKEIVRLEAEDNYTHIYLRNGERITACKTIKAYEEMLQPINFYRVHKSHVINLNYMRKFVRGDGGYVIMDDGKKIDVSRRRRPAFLEQMRKLQDGL